MTDMRQWLTSLGLGEYWRVFDDNAVDFRVLPSLTEDDLKELGLKLGHRRLLQQAIASLAAVPDSDGAARPSLTADAERRQLTVMFCDLVGSTELSQRLDPEDLRHVMTAYQDACKRAIERFEGYVARYMGDGVLAYFGYPQAHEDDAERALRAALDLVGAVTALDGQTVRVGIATGSVVVGDLIGEASSQERAVVGETPNLAARLQGLAMPGQVVVAPATHRLTMGHFHFADLGSHTLKGLDAPVHAHAVEHERAPESRFAAVHDDQLAPLVGRREEMDALERRWSRAREGEGQVVLLVGEPGIGKSRLCESFSETIVGERHRCLRYQCSPHHVDSPFQPVIAQLERAAGFVASVAPEGRLARLEELLSGPDALLEEDLSLISALLSLDPPAHYRPLSLAPAEQRERTLAALTRQLTRTSVDEPVLLMFEDIHWVDPSTLDLLQRLVERVVDLPILLLVTFRPEFEESWSGQAHVTLMALNRLPRRECLAMLDEIPEVADLDAGMLDEIVSRTDGVPLFIEELTRTVLESATGARAGGDTEAPFTVPTTLQDSLMARLDRLPAGKPVAQAASVIGRDFDRALLVEVCDLDSVDVTSGIDELVASALVLRRSGEQYQFKHALVRDAAYASLLKARRAELHSHTVRAMSGVFLERGEAEPEVVARHCESAAAWQEAARWWRGAATKAGRRAATAECVRHLQRAVAAIERLGEDAHPRQSIDTRLELVAALRVSEGMEEALDALDAAETLATRHGLDDLRSRVHYQRGNALFPLARTDECLTEHRRALELARGTGTTELEAMALGGIGDGEYARGRMLSASRAFAACTQLAQEQNLPLIMAPNLAMQGFVSQYTFRITDEGTRIGQSLEMARELGIPRVEVLALSCLTYLLLETGQHEEVETLCAEQEDLIQQLGAWRFETVRYQQLARAALMRGERALAREHAEAALRLYDRVPASFDRARALGVLALVSDDPSTRRRLLSEGEKAIATGGLAHNWLKFYRDAIDTCLEMNDADAVERYARALSHHARAESMPYTEFHATRGEALAAVLRGGEKPGLRTALARLRDEALAATLPGYLQQIDRALAIL